MKKIVLLAAAFAPLFLLLIVFISVAAVLSGASAGYQIQVSAQGGGLSETVLAYEPLVEEYCEQYGISDYVPLVLAIMQQESGEWAATRCRVRSVLQI
jgi:hypothetical protein